MNATAPPTGGTCLVHLVWKPLGLQPFRDFISSYRQHPTGVDHRLFVVFNGFAADDRLDEYRHALDGLAYEHAVLPAPVQDLCAYFAAARLRHEQTICFLNSYSVILQDGWLQKLCAALSEPGVGIVGAAGNHESFYASAVHYARRPTPRGLVRRLARRLRTAWTLAAAKRDFPPFPNFHLRTNAFLLERELLLSLRPGTLCSKRACHLFESGKQSLTRQIAARGLAARVVGRDGRAYPPEQWPASETFRQGEQRNLLVADNRTRQYSEGDEELRRELAAIAWSDVRETPWTIAPH